MGFHAFFIGSSASYSGFFEQIIGLLCLKSLSMVKFACTSHLEGNGPPGSEQRLSIKTPNGHIKSYELVAILSGLIQAL